MKTYLYEIFPQNQLLKGVCTEQIYPVYIESVDRDRCERITVLEIRVQMGRITQLQFDEALQSLEKDMQQVNRLCDAEFDSNEVPEKNGKRDKLMDMLLIGQEV